MQRADRVSKDECGEDVEGRLLGHPEQCRKHDLLGLLVDDFDDGSPLDSALIQELLEHRRLEDAESNPEANADENDRKRKWNSPAPGNELIAIPRTESKNRQIRQE